MNATQFLYDPELATAKISLERAQSQRAAGVHSQLFVIDGGERRSVGKTLGGGGTRQLAFASAGGNLGKWNAARLFEGNASSQWFDVVEEQLSGAAAATQFTGKVVRHESGVEWQEASLAKATIGEADQFSSGPTALPTAQRRA